jgi:hypothetical protein
MSNNLVQNLPLEGRTLLSMMLIVWGPAELMEIYIQEEKQEEKEPFSYRYIFFKKKMRERFRSGLIRRRRRKKALEKEEAGNKR